MPDSMTGFGRAEGEAGGRRMTVEAKSVNHRYLDFRLHLPLEMEPLEIEIQTLIKKHLNRGRLEMTIVLAPALHPAPRQWNREAARGYLAAMQEMRSELGVAGEPDLALLLAQKDVMMMNESESFPAGAWAEAEGIIERCLRALEESRAAEGRSLGEDLAGRLKRLLERIERLQADAPRGVKAYRERLERRLKELGLSADPVRLAQEVVLFADRSDVSEELVRLGTHAVKFGEILADDGPVGRRLDFLLQEMHREANTVGAKIQDAELAQEVVELKAELERMREQVQNLE